ncbi:MAG: glycoside hydrolase family 3 C-terminal domain-containing protein [Candidatus Andeanibacterium colombiense]|uniref:Glycoside hydrolase family 3 C-terminal domain-containing protein n=1 Tax=Candidatus Andeanibacterium colombiense TaxID=3121345 RepID=A0AAJ5X787_9SPHN|nr:MAG: glycoside hydrolase family 3 C-terminal domain-containing protein [Sphingomonadaceae bacterium]
MPKRAATIVFLLATTVCAAVPAAAQVSGQAALWGTQGADCTAKPGEAKPWTDISYSPECRARFVLQQFKTVEEKLRFLSPPPPGLDGDEAAESHVRDVARELGIPQIGGSDGPAGLVRGPAATALPSPLAVGASFDPAMAAQYGDVVGSEFRAAGLGTILGPAYDVARSWKFGRLSESMGEDPFLMAHMAAAEVKAITARKVLVQMKHFANYAQEAGRVGDQPSGSAPAGNNAVSEKALREIYLPSFEAAVKQGGAGGVMCSFPRINGVYSCENAHLFDILKREWRFDGFVGPDFPSGQRSITRAVMAGLDSGSFAASSFNAALAHEKSLADAVRDGEVPESRLDDMILRRLIPYYRIGIFDDLPLKTGDDVSTQAARDTAAEILAGGTVLLKNEGGILPFGKNVRSVAVIGVQAGPAADVVELGSPFVNPKHLVPALDAIKARAGVKVTYAPGTLGTGPLPEPKPGLFRTAGGMAGFTAEYFANPNMDFAGKPLASEVVAEPSLAKSPAIPGLPENNQWSVRYTANFTPKMSGLHKFALHGSGSARLFVDGQLRSEFVLADFASAIFAPVELKAGRPVDVRIEYSPRAALRPERMTMFGQEMGLTLRFGYAPPDDLIAKAVAAARKADVAVVFAGERFGEGMDRASLSLQNDQDALIAAVAAANPNTVVVLSTGGPVTMPWLPKVRGVLETWMGGDAYGPAVAGMLFGDREPGGRLPVTFPADATQGPATHPWQFPGTIDPATGRLDTAYFDEGVLVGYRFWDAHGQQPLFPFGYGLSYGEIGVGNESARSQTDGSIVATARLTNSGKRQGSEVLQLYLGFPTAAGPAPKQLKGFAKVTLKPGETRDVAITVKPEDLRYWNEDQPGWKIAPGEYTVYLARSSRDIVWQGKVTIMR